jgi:hypothetical protein
MFFNNIYFRSLPKLYNCHRGLVFKTNQKSPIKMVKSKATCLVGHGGKKTIWGGISHTIFDNETLNFTTS